MSDVPSLSQHFGYGQIGHPGAIGYESRPVMGELLPTWAVTVLPALL